MHEMLWFGDDWWWFAVTHIAVEPEVEWRDNRVYLLESDGSAVEGIKRRGLVVRFPPVYGTVVETLLAR
jgi:hypothetical protein